MMGPYNMKLEQKHDKNYTELCIENYFAQKNHSALSKQLTTIFIKFLTFNSIQDGLFRGYSWMGGWGKEVPHFLKSVTHILQ